ncbi:MAG: bifunctional indole-3-glycerol-phosphate synthase TrpC/phosphoribosylanthranilate isomerase TrpF [Corynebacterium sp.]|nr:bifunctional indole-3-glycerol-phosphate synthase TrpC/phosphoribosylanthranilate isomerase TrpF [Corynebacterium sp.]
MALPTVLENIVARRRTHLAGIAERIGDAAPGPSTRSLFDSLNQPGHQFIMECKAASPSLGVIRADYHPGDIARVYSRYAAGISVLCEPERFHGDYDHLATVAASTHLPVLCKDFIIDPVQVRAARHYGADAILLMLSVLSNQEYAELAAVAESYNLDILTEVVDEEEMARAEKLGAKIIGVNHRNLHDLSIDLGRSAKLAKLLPEGALLVAESGIRDHRTVVELAGHSDAFLVGSQLTGTPDVDEACRKLLYGELKVCGLTEGTSAQAARAMGATYGGLIFEEASPRYITAEKAVEIMDAEPNLKYVAVVRNLESLKQVPADPRIVAYQIHAAVDARPEIPEDKEFWLAINADNPPAQIPEAQRYILDKGQGGSGQAFDWNSIENLALSEEQLGRTLLAGGLNVDNIEGALGVVDKQKMAGVDLNSGVERAPGTKDAVKLRECTQTIRTFHI